ncbi:OsmC-like protein [Achlya hypogyna]|uniref:OsmC-like protein n=1 Tax=Achlya hypogyna TaxID=1202772 RepID=A0A1V9YF33_ACHHY|nr:OsmC-like protein [Achlya hypogyna]
MRRFTSAAKPAAYHLTGRGTGVQCHMNRGDGLVMATDVPVRMGGTDSAPQPVELFLTSLCGCELATAQFVARHMTPRLTIEKIEFSIHAVRDPAGALTLPLSSPAPPARLERIWGTATVFTSASQVQVDELSEHVKQRCPVANMAVLSGCKLDIKWRQMDPDDDED